MAIERLLLKPGWRFSGLQLFSTGPWKAWAFFLLTVICTALLLWIFWDQIQDLIILTS